MFNKQGTSGLPEVSNNIDGTLATHAADCGRGRMSQLFRFVLYFLDLEFSQEFFASDLKIILKVKTDPKPDPNPGP